MRYTFSNYNDNTHTDWLSYDNVGVDAPAYLLTGYLSGGDYQRDKQLVYMTTHFAKTEHFSTPIPLLTLNGSFGDGAPNTSYSQVMSISGGIGPYTLQNISGVIPTGLTLFIDGDFVRLVGVSVGPSPATTFSFDVTSSDGQTAHSSQTVEIYNTYGFVSVPGANDGNTVRIFSKPESGWIKAQTIVVPLSWVNGFNAVRSKVGSPYIALSPHGTSPDIAVIPILKFVDKYVGYVYEEHTLLGVSNISYLSAEVSLDGSLLVVSGAGSSNNIVYIFSKQNDTTWALIQQISCISACTNAKLSSDNEYLFASVGVSNYNGHMFKRDSSGIYQTHYAGPTRGNFIGYETTINEKNGTWLWDGAALGYLSLVSWVTPDFPVTLLSNVSSPPAGNYNLISQTGTNYIWSQDGSYLFSLNSGGSKLNCYKYNPVGSGPYFTLVSSVTPAKNINVALDISSDGKYIFSSGNAGMQLFSVDQTSGIPVITQVDPEGLAEIIKFAHMGVLY